MLKKKKKHHLYVTIGFIGCRFIKLYLIPLYLFTKNKKFDTVITD